MLVLDGSFGLPKGKLKLAAELTYEKDELENPTQPNADDFFLVVGIVLGEDELGPEFLDDPVAEKVVLVQIDLLTDLALVELGVDSSQVLLDKGGILLQLLEGAAALLRLHELYDFL